MSEAVRHAETLSVCLVEYNPLAARHLRQVLEKDAFELLSHRDVLETRRRPSRRAAVFVLDRGALPTSLSKFLRFLRLRQRDALTLVLGDPLPQQELFRLLFLGIQGFLAYDDVDSQLAEAVRAVADGRLWVAPEVLEKYVRYSSALSRPRGVRGEALTNQEQRILALVQRRLANKEIGSILRISEATVKYHLTIIFAKLGVTDRHSVVELASSPALDKLLPHKSEPEST